jgi:signal transduction histidine kinase
MGDKAKVDWSRPRFRWAGGLVIGLALAVLGGTLAWAALDLRARIRAKIVQRDAEILDAVTVMQHLNDQAAGETIASLADPGEQFQLALKVSRLRNVLGVRLYGSDGKFINAFPAYITETALPAAALAALQRLEPVSSFSARARMEEQDLLAETNSAPVALLFVEVPLRTDGPPRLAGVVQFLMDGSSIARQYADLDRDLVLKFSIAFLAGAAVLSAGLGLALRRVRRANEALAERTRHLLQANRELALAARTSAVGAVASHLIHGLKNPLSGLRSFVHLHNVENSNGTEAEWQVALGTTQRMEELINRVVRVLQEQQSGVEYEISIQELCGLLAPKAQAMAEAAGVRFEAKVRFNGRLSNREADLISLILENLVQNAIEATRAGKTVELKVTEAAGRIVFEVRDEGCGLPPGVKARLFTPCTSDKKGGGGIGLAISKQLAQSLGAQLELAASTESGCTFRLAVLPSATGAIPSTQLEKDLALNPPG